MENALTVQKYPKAVQDKWYERQASLVATQDLLTDNDQALESMLEEQLSRMMKHHAALQLEALRQLVRPMNLPHKLTIEKWAWTGDCGLFVNGVYWPDFYQSWATEWDDREDEDQEVGPMLEILWDLYQRLEKTLEKGNHWSNRHCESWTPVLAGSSLN